MKSLIMLRKNYLSRFPDQANVKSPHRVIIQIWVVCGLIRNILSKEGKVNKLRGNISYRSNHFTMLCGWFHISKDFVFDILWIWTFRESFFDNLNLSSDCGDAKKKVLSRSRSFELYVLLISTFQRVTVWWKRKTKLKTCKLNNYRMVNNQSLQFITHCSWLIKTLIFTV